MKTVTGGRAQSIGRRGKVEQVSPSAPSLCFRGREWGGGLCTGVGGEHSG